MRNFKFWATIILAASLGIIGYFLGNSVDFPPPFTHTKMRVILALAGVLAGLLSFARIAAWVVKTVTHLVTRGIMVLSLEITKQFTHASKMFSGADLPLPGHFEESIIIDTSSIIDGRILDVAKTGFLCGTMLIPKFVLSELQQVADSADSIKRSRGRRGFDVINQLKRIRGVKIKILGEDVSVGETVDEKLVSLARSFKAKLLTTDFNLNRMAKLRGAMVLNLNELANALKTLPVPGERLSIKIVHPGKDKTQGVGYLTDGTMIVIKDGSSAVGQEIEVEVTKILQIPSGRMIFAKMT